MDTRDTIRSPLLWKIRRIPPSRALMVHSLFVECHLGCNASGTFQRCMMAIFSDMVEKSIEVFMNDFSMIGSTFNNCLHNLTLVLKRCMETNLVLNWEKCHFMVREA